MFRKVLLILFFTFIVIPGVCQENIRRFDDRQDNRSAGGVVRIFQDKRIDTLISMHISANKKLSGVPGFRIRIFSQSGHSARPNANQMRTEFLIKYPETGGYLTYDAPNFKVYVGDFRTRSEALKFLKQVSRDFPNAFIVADRINLPKE